MMIETISARTPIVMLALAAKAHMASRLTGSTSAATGPDADPNAMLDEAHGEILSSLRCSRAICG